MINIIINIYTAVHMYNKKEKNNFEIMVCFTNILNLFSDCYFSTFINTFFA